MIDSTEIIVEGGKGGEGIVSFRREKYVAKGGPDGGDGGKGGDVFLVATRETNSLSDNKRKYSYKAPNGGSGGGNNRHGKNGEDLAVAVPVGTIISDENGKKLFDFVKDNSSFKVAVGGHGGLGNKKFATSINRVPRERTGGQKGEKKTLFLELKLIADVGLVGLPNAGKSTLIASITKAKPKIADYPFSTLEPVLGVAKHKGATFTIADIPGLIEGASAGKGLGDKFLKHIERTKIIIHLIRADSSNPKKDYTTVRRELELFSDSLSKKKEIIAITHCDIVSKNSIENNFKSPLFKKAVAIVAPSRKNTDKLQDNIIRALGKTRK